MRTFAIGDVHGHAALLRALFARIELAASGEPFRVVCLGDYIDRGPASAEVIAFLREREAALGAERLICLKGNHEELMLRAADDERSERTWLANGGVEALASFGVASIDAVPPDILAWVAARPSFFEDDWRCYVHAGLDPARHRHDQVDADRLWIRERFLAVDHDFGRVVVHGHTPQSSGRPDIRPHRVNLDTGAAYGGPLTAAMFLDGEGSPAEILQVWSDAP